MWRALGLRTFCLFQRNYVRNRTHNLLPHSLSIWQFMARSPLLTLCGPLRLHRQFIMATIYIASRRSRCALHGKKVMYMCTRLYLPFRYINSELVFSFGFLNFCHFSTTAAAEKRASEREFYPRLSVFEPIYCDQRW